jgi:hypothetical protein
MCTVLVSYDKRNKVAAQAMQMMSMMKGVKINYDFKRKSKMNGLDEAIEDVKMGRVENCSSVDEFKKIMRKKYNYV